MDSTRNWLKNEAAARATFWLATWTAVALSIALRGDPVAGADSDVSWLTTMCERILHGERAYVDVFDTTPPLPLLLYMPGVIVGTFSGIAPEAFTFVFAYAAALVSLWLAARILPETIAERGESKWLLLAPVAMVLIVLPMTVFAQREYFAAAFSLPIIAVFIHHAREGTWPALMDRFAAAALAGIALAIKAPLFALPGIFVAVYYLHHTRGISFLLPSGLLAAGFVGAALTIASLAAFPSYFGDILLVLRDVYVPLRQPFLTFLGEKGSLGVLSCLAIVTILSVRQKPPAAALIASVAAFGFFIADLIQGKYFYYHVFPAAPLAAAAACLMVYRRLCELAGASLVLKTRASAVYAAAFLGVCWLFSLGFVQRLPVMSDLSWAQSFNHPRALAVSPDGGLSFPFARRIGAAWVDRSHSQWIADVTRYALQDPHLQESRRTKLSSYHDDELRRILREIRAKTPDIIFQDVWPDHRWLTLELSAMEPGFLDEYCAIAEEGPIRVLLRKSEANRAVTCLPANARPGDDAGDALSRSANPKT